jgi:hypothetical protein
MRKFSEIPGKSPIFALNNQTHPTMTPEQVMKALAADWRQKGLTYHDIAQQTGYKYQTIANFIAGKKTFFTSAQALRFKPMGYNLNFLMFGEGTLRSEDDPASLLRDGNDFLPEGYKVYCLLTALKALGDITGDPLVQDVHRTFFRAFTTPDSRECLEAIDQVRQTLAVRMVSQGAAGATPDR